MVNVRSKSSLGGESTLGKGMIERNAGTMRYLGSVAGRETFDLSSENCGTKFAVHAITESMRKEVSGKNVRMIVISPGMVDTDLVSHTSDPKIVDDYNGWRKAMHGGLSAEAVADCLSYAYNQPQGVCVREIVVAKTGQAD